MKWGSLMYEPKICLCGERTKEALAPGRNGSVRHLKHLAASKGQPVTPYDACPYVNGKLFLLSSCVAVFYK